MADFVLGVLERNAVGAAYEGVIFDRNLTLRIWNGPRLDIFDSEAISQGIPSGQNYEMLLEAIPSLDSVEPISSPPASIEASEWQGTIIHRAWNAPVNHFRWVDPSLYKTFQGDPARWALFATSIGDIVMNPGLIARMDEQTLYVRWQNMRLDLLAVV